MSKPANKTLILPGAIGWEIWTGQPESGFTLHEATTIERAGDLTALPQGDISLLFPVKSITAIPLKVTTEDESLFPELAAMHAERLGIRPDPMAGQLSDTFIIDRQGETTALLSIQLRPPGEGDMPTRGPKEFDLSARAFPTTGECLAIWKEFGRWVFAFHHAGNTVYCQATSISDPVPGDDLVREIRLAQIQLSLQGIELDPSRVALWTDETPSTEALSTAFRCPVEVSPRPAPVLPTPRCKLLPADVRAARRAALRRRNIILTTAAIVLAYFGLIGYQGQKLWRIQQETARLETAALAAAPDAKAFEIHKAKWRELSHAVESQYSPIEILHRVARCIPPGGLRLRKATVTATEITLVGEAQQPAIVNQFRGALTRSKDLANFKWSTSEPTQSTRGWEFNFRTEIPKN